MSDNSETNTKFFDLHTVGIGYLNRAREVNVQRGDNFHAVDIAALHGAADNVEYTRFDCRVSGKEAERVIQSFQGRINQKDCKVLVGFKIGDLYPDTFVYKSGDKAGQTGVSLKARLLKIAWLRVDGETVYTAPKPDQADSAAADQNGQAA